MDSKREVLWKMYSGMRSVDSCRDEAAWVGGRCSERLCKTGDVEISKSKRWHGRGESESERGVPHWDGSV